MGIGTVSDNFYVGSQGVLRLTGTAMAWDDLRFPANMLKINPAKSEPVFSEGSVGYLFKAGNTDPLMAVVQFPHAWKQGDYILPHIHWLQGTPGSVVWNLDYKWYNVQGTVPVAWGKIVSHAQAFNFSAGTLSQLTSFGTILGPGKTISSILKARIFRTGSAVADTIPGTVFFDEFDIHYRKNSFGSRKLTLKD